MIIPDMSGVLRHLIHNYGQLTPEDVAAFVTTFSGQETRKAQNDVHLYYCIADTLDERFISESYLNPSHTLWEVLTAVSRCSSC
jgi:hypothetical protein